MLFRSILALEKSQIGEARVQDCLIDNVHAPNCPALNRMTGTMANVDELDWLGKQLCFHYTIDEHITEANFRNLFFRLVFIRNLTGCFDQVCHDLIELRGVFGRNDRHAGLLFDCFPSIARDLTAGACNLDVFSQTFRRFLLGNLCCCGFGQHK